MTSTNGRTMAAMGEESSAPPAWLQLSHQARVLWGKSDRVGGEEWLPLYQHMADSADVARLIWREWPAATIRRQMAKHAGGEEQAEALIVWLAAAHDLGKAAPSFQYKWPALAERVRAAGLSLPDHKLHHPPYHALMSQAILYQWLKGERKWYGPIALTYAIVAGGHHGVPPNYEDMEKLLRSSQQEGLGDQKWALVQNELIDYTLSLSGAGPFLSDLQTRPLPPSLQMLLTGLVIMADWIASNGELFPLFPSSDPSSLAQRGQVGWRHLNLPPAWQPVTEPPDNDVLFHSRFSGIAPAMMLRPCQNMLLHATESMSSPGLIILEAPMASGKTEAALLAAEKIASKHGQGGVAFLLPTMATSNAMFTRIHKWLGAVPDARGPHQTQTMNLVHGRAALNEDYTQLKQWKTWSMGDDVCCSRETAIAHTWLSGRKLSLLASFIIGTVDQLLMAALKARHVVLRHLGLASKVVIIDEAHAYDAYMNVYLDRALAWLGAYKVPVIILSATLPPSRRNALVNAYTEATRVSISIPEAPRTPSDNSPDYPLATICENHDVRYMTGQDSSRSLRIGIEEFPDDDNALLELLRAVMENGGCVGIMRNTVSRAQATYQLLHENLDVPVILDHSRFIACDRARKDAEVISLLGKDAKARPKQLIIVGTQVLEQSLDIDFDLLISDIAPIDLLLQRLGRLHRHEKWNATRPSRMRQPRAFITGVTDWATQPPTVDKDITFIYEMALLLRTFAVLRQLDTPPTGTSICLPTDIARLVEAVYEDRVSVPPEWQESLVDADAAMDLNRQKKEKNAKDYLLPKVRRDDESVTGLLIADLVGADDDNRRGQATVRDSIDTIEVFLVQKRLDGKLYLLPWVTESNPSSHGGREMSEAEPRVAHMDEKPLDMELATQFEPDHRTARLAATCTVCLPSQMNYESMLVIDELEKQGGFAGWQESPWLRGQLPLIIDENMNASVTVTNDHTESVHQFVLHYDRDLGLRLRKEEDQQ